VKTKLGILGGGQLARMMLPVATRFDLNVQILDKAGSVCQDYCAGFKEGDFQNAKDVFKAMRSCEVVTMDLEAVSYPGLCELEKNGVRVAPSAQVIGIIQNKISQKEFFSKYGLPTSKFEVIENLSEKTPQGFLKLPTGGYDGKGVISFKGDLSLVPEPFRKNVLWEEKVEIEKEISVVVARNRFKELKNYSSTEMVFDPQLNLISYTLFPARISAKLEEKACALACEVAEKLEVEGVLAVELFITKTGDILINELAPRPHNSGHHTIESCMTSQYENHLRGVLGLPLGSTKKRDLSLTFNLIGKGSGPSRVVGHEELLAEEGCFIHLYGKKECRPGRKMGHVTLTAATYDQLIEKYKRLNKVIMVTGEGDKHE
jgi:5-(carboxyamino)imidazole ribonucleotide synthase